ncbi:MAG: tetratricopeptide repeat protein [Chloroflexi bacterium]|nr:tetratricopeptide repeat protein [Chloroflexota bacterium]
MHTRLSAYCTRLIEAGWLAVAAVVPAFFNVYSSRVFEPDKLTVFRGIALIMVAAWLVKVAETFSGDFDLRAWLRRFLAMPLVKPALVFTAVYLFTTLTSIDPNLSFWGSYQRLQGTLNNLGYVAVFLLMLSHFQRQRQVDRLVWTILLISLPISMYGIIQHFKLDPLPWGGDVSTRVTSSMGNPIFLGAYLLMVIPLTVARLADGAAALWISTGGTGRWSLIVRTGALAVLFVLQLTALLYTESRGPWLGFGASIAVFALLALARWSRWRAFAVAVVLAVAAAAFVLLLNVDGSPIARLRGVSPYLARLGTMLDVQEGTNRVRILIWQGDGVGTGAIGLITASPLRFLVGYGPETMYVAYNPYYPPDLAHFEARNASPDRSHNDFLDFMVTMGLVGLLAYLGILVGFFRLAGRTLWGRMDRTARLLLIALIAGIAGHLVETFFGIAIAATRTHFWLFLGMTSAMALGFEARQVVAPAMTAAEPVLVGAGAGGAAPPRPSGVARSRKGKARRLALNGTPPARPAAAGRLTGDALPIVVWIVATAAAVPALLLGNLIQRWQVDPAIQVIAGFGWLVAGMLLAAAAIEGPPVLRKGWRSGSAWLYGLLVVATVLVIAFPFLGSITADIQFKKGQAYDGSNRFDLSVSAYLDALRWAPGQDFYYLFLGRAYLELAKRLPERPGELRSVETVDDLQKLRVAQPQNLSRELLLSASLVSLQEARRINPLNTDNSANLARLHRFWAEMTTDPAKKAERFATAERWYEKATALSPNAAHLYDEWGVIYHLQNRYDDALVKYRIAEKLDDRYPTTFVYLGDAFLAKGDLDQARPAYERALSIDSRLITARSALGYIFQRQGNLQAALEQNLKAQEIAPNDLVTLRNLAVLYNDLGNREKALATAEAALKVAPKDQQQPLQAFVDQLKQKR